MSRKLKICMAQMEVIPGNPRANVTKMLECISKAKQDNADVICFPEMCIPGYILSDTWERTSFIEDCNEYENDIINVSKDSSLVIIYGTVCTSMEDRKNEDGRMRKYNSAVIVQDGKVVSTRIKSLQPNYREFDDNRHFYDFRKLMFDEVINGNKSGYVDVNKWLFDNYKSSITINETRIGVMLCEDGWNSDYTLSPSKYLFPNSDIVFNISCSPFTYGKKDKRNRVFSAHAKEHGKPLVYVNNVGVQNNGKTVFTFDGDSCIYDKDGKQFNPYVPFEEGCQTFEIDLNDSISNNPSLPLFKTDRTFDIGISGITTEVHKDDIYDLYKAIRYGTSKFMESVGINKVVIGASGGIDSAVVSYLMVDILGNDNVILVNMPSHYNSDITKNAAKNLAYALGCRYVVHPIQNAVNLTTQEIKNLNFNIIRKGNHELSSLAVENVQARDRSSRILAAWAAWFGGVFTCNANKSEMTVGYTTLYGDLGGFLAPISDLWKGQVYELANFINDINGDSIIPLDSINVVPSAELSDNQDVTKGKGDPLNYPYHDKLFASWVEKWNRATPEDNLRWYLEGTINTILGYKGNVYDLFPNVKAFTDDLERWWNLYCGMAVAKRVQAPPVLAVSCRAYGYDHRETQVKPYYTKKYLDMKEQALKE